MKGITGTIGAGKSLVGRILRDKKIRVIDADVAVHHLYRDDKALRAAIDDYCAKKGLPSLAGCDEGVGLGL